MDDTQEFCVVVYRDTQEWAVPQNFGNGGWERLPEDRSLAGHWLPGDAFSILTSRRKALDVNYSIELRPWPLEFPYVR